MPHTQFPNALTDAAEIFNQSIVSLMAHTIRATVNYFRQKHLELDIIVHPDRYGTIVPLTEAENGEKQPASVLRTHKPDGSKRVVATIWIHANANKNLARICIAHEIFHLLCELHEWVKDRTKPWPKIPMSPILEDKCNQFAWELCRKHDLFNRNEVVRERLIFFPDKLFDQPFTTDLSRKENWPQGIGFDRENPFYLHPPLPSS